MKKTNSNLFKSAMRKFATGVTIISINRSEKYIGKTVNSFASLSLKPPLILFSLDRKSSSLKEYKLSRFIGVNILSHKQKKLSDYFSQKNASWNNIETFLSSNNIPLIKNCVTNLDCQKIKNIVAGDHIIFICKINKLRVDENKKPLIYFNSKYKK